MRTHLQLILSNIDFLDFIYKCNYELKRLNIEPTTLLPIYTGLPKYKYTTNKYGDLIHEYDCWFSSSDLVTIHFENIFEFSFSYDKYEKSGYMILRI